MKPTLEILFPLLILVASVIALVLLFLDLLSFKKKEKPKEPHPKSYLSKEYGVFKRSDGWVLIKERDIRILQETNEMIEAGDWYEIMSSKSKDAMIEEYYKIQGRITATEEQIL